MSTLRSPQRRGLSSAAKEKTNSSFSRRKDPASAMHASSDVADLAQELRTVAVTLDCSEEIVNNLFQRLQHLDTSIKRNDKDIHNLLEAIEQVPLPYISPSSVHLLAIYIHKLEVQASSALNCKAISFVFSLLLLELCKLLENPEWSETDSNMVGLYLSATIDTLRSAAPHLGRLAGPGCQLLLALLPAVAERSRNSTVPTTWAKADENQPLALLLEGLGYCAAPVAHPVAAEGDAESAALQRIHAQCGVNSGETWQGVVSVLSQHFSNAYQFLAQLPTATAPATTATDSSSSGAPTDLASAQYTATLGQLHALLASAKALSLIYTQLASVGGVPRISAAEVGAQFTLVPAVDRLLRNVMPTLSKRLQLVAVAAERAVAAHPTTVPAIPMPPASESRISTAARALYRPPSQRGPSSTPPPPALFSAPAAHVASPYVSCMAALKTRLSAQVLTLLGTLAALNPGAFVSSWSLFLTDSLTAEAALLAKSERIVQCVGANCADTAATVVVHAIGPIKLSSPILGTMLQSSTVAVRCAAVNSLQRFLAGLPLKTFLAPSRPGTIGRLDSRSSSTSRVVGRGTSNGGSSAVGTSMSKQQKLLLKVVDTVVVMLDAEQSEEVLEALLKLAALLLDHMPLSASLQLSRALRFGSSAAASPYEAKASAIYCLAFRIALRYEVPELRGSLLSAPSSASELVPPAPRNITSAYVALVWVADRIRNAESTNALVQALQYRYLPCTTDISAGRTLVYAAAHCVLRAVAPSNTNTLYCVAMRTLNTVLCQRHPSLYLRDPAWLRSLLLTLEIHSQAGLRLQGSKILTLLLEHELPSSTGLPNYVPIKGDFLSDTSIGRETMRAAFEQFVSVGRSLRDNYAVLLTSCADDAHIVRTQAMLALGSLTAYVWRILEGAACSKQDLLMLASMAGVHSVPTPTIATKRVVLLRCLLAGAQDSVGTVRTAAFKSLGDCVSHCALLLSARTPATAASMHAAVVHPLLGEAELALLEDLVPVLRAGVADSKLSVRVQAAWALGHFVVDLLPYRWQYSSSSSGDQPLSWLTDACWLGLHSGMLPLLHDSEKLAATAVRCVGNITAGLCPQSSSQQLEAVRSLQDLLIQRYFAPSFIRDCSPLPQWRSLKESVTQHTQKVAFSLSQCLGFAFHVLAQGEGWPRNEAYLSEVLELQMAFLRHAKLKTQLQAARVLLYCVCLQRESAHNKNGLSQDSVAQLTRLLEVLLSLTPFIMPARSGLSAAGLGTTNLLTFQLPHSEGAPSSSSSGSTAAGTEEVREEVVQLFRTRAAELLHYFALLLHAVLGQLWTATAGASGSSSAAEARRQSVMELLLYYGEDLAGWAEALTTGGVQTQAVYSAGNTSVGLPHIAFDLCAALHCQGKAQTALVAEVAAVVLRFAAAPSSASRNQHMGGALERLPSLASECLSASLMARFAVCAQNAPWTFRRALFGDDYSDTNGLLLLGGYSYGVFDGLDPPSHPFSVSPTSALTAAAGGLLGSPRTTPSKAAPLSPAAANAAASPSLGYALQSTAAEGDDEDEF